MQELNEKELEQVVGGTSIGTTYGNASGQADASGWGGSSSTSYANSTITPNNISSGASNQSQAGGWYNSFAVGGAGTSSTGVVY